MSILRVYVTSHCAGCKEAVRLGGEVSKRLSDLTVEIVDLEEAERVKFDEVFATPAFVLNGRLLALGNPRLEQLEEWIARALRKEVHGDG